MEKREWKDFKGSWRDAEIAACICKDGGNWIETMDGYRSECTHCHAEVDNGGSDNLQILKGREPTYREEMNTLFDNLSNDPS